MGPALQVLFNINRLLSTTNQQNSLNGSIILFKQGLTGLVRMLTGCGEQNMVLLSRPSFTLFATCQQRTNLKMQSRRNRSILWKLVNKSIAAHSDLISWFGMHCFIFFNRRLPKRIYLSTRRRILFGVWQKRPRGQFVAYGLCRQIICCCPPLHSRRWKRFENIHPLAHLQTKRKRLFPTIGTVLHHDLRVGLWLLKVLSL